MILGHGRDSANIMFIGDWGLREDSVRGVALSGAQERTMGNFMKEAGYNLSHTYRTLYIKDVLDYDGKSKKLKFEAIKKAFTSAKEKGLDYDTILKEEILSIRPNVIVPMGDLSLKFVSGYSPISSYRGSVLPFTPFLQSSIPEKTIRVVGTFSPRLTWENYTSRVYVQLDYNKIVSLRERTDEIEAQGQIWVCRSVEAFRNFLARHRDIMSRPSDQQFITVDIETYLGFITAIGFCFDGKEALSIPMMETKIDYANSLLLCIEIAKVLDSMVPKVNQHIRYDWGVCERFGFRFRNVTGDTVLGFHLLYPELPKNLGFQTSIYTNLPYFKDESSKKGSEWNPKSYTKDSLYLYNAKDALATWQIHHKQVEEMKEAGVYHLYRDKVVPLIPIYKALDDRGLHIDRAKRRFLKNKYKSLLEVTATQFMNRIAPIHAFESTDEVLQTIRSPTKFGSILYDVLKFPVKYNTSEHGKRTYKTDKNTLDELLIKHESIKLKDEAKRLLKYAITMRKIFKVLEYIDTAIHPDNVFRTSSNISGTETARSSGSKTTDSLLQLDKKGKLIWPMKRLGRSLQTITKHGFEIDGELYDSVGDDRLGKDLRAMFVPRNGYCFIEFDRSQAEARVVAVLAEDYDLLEQFDKKPKVHARTAALIFGVDAQTITKDYPIVPDLGITYYDMGKRIRHAGNLGMQEFMLAQQTHIDIADCRNLLNKFHESCPKVRGVFHAETYECVKRTGQLRSPNGRVRQFFERIDNNHTIKEIFSQIPQSTVSDQTKFSLIPLTNAMPWAHPVYEGHDALMFEVPLERKMEFIEKTNVIAGEDEIDFINCSLSRDVRLKIPIEFSVGMENWSEMQEVKL